MADTTDSEDSTSLYDKFSDLLNKGLDGYKTYTADKLAQANEDLATKLAAQNKSASTGLPGWALPVGIGAGVLVLLLVAVGMFSGKKN